MTIECGLGNDRVEILGVLLFEVPEAIVRSGKGFPTRRKMTCKCALKVNCFYVALKIFA